MTSITNFEELRQLAFSSENSATTAIAAVWPMDEASQQTLSYLINSTAVSLHIFTAADDSYMHELAQSNPKRIKLAVAADPGEASRMAVAAVRTGEVNVIYKGLVATDVLLHAILNRNEGILAPGAVLTHMTAASVPARGSLILFTDAAVIPDPTDQQLEAMARYGIALCHKLGIKRPKVATIHFTEKASDKFPYTLCYQRLSEMAERGEFGEAAIGGPMDIKSACDRHYAEIKGITGEVAGHANLLIFPNLVAANTFYKTMALFGGADMAGIVVGADVPIVVPSRADTYASKLDSIALACVAGNML